MRYRSPQNKTPAAAICLLAVAQTSLAQTSPGQPTVLSKVQVSDTADSETTEGTGAYTTGAVTIGGLTAAPREIPSSVSVITRERIEEQNFISLEDAMQYTTGVKVTTYGTATAAVESRGYTIDHYEIDGVSSSQRVYENNFALAMYDRIEVWRGPSGLLQGSGDPGGTVNLVRKRAQSEFTVSGRVLAGSWNNYQGELDVTGPLVTDGRLRGRFVAAYQDRDYFTDLASTREPLFYGTVEYDFTPATTLAVGSSWQRNHSRPFLGYPAYEDGGYADIPRSTFVGASWNEQSQRVSHSFVELTQRVAGDGTVKLTASFDDRNNEGKIAWGNSYIDRTTGDFDVIPYFSTSVERETNVDAQWIQSAQWRGLQQQWQLGVSYQRLHVNSAYNASTYGDNGFVQNIFTPNPYVPEPDIALDPPSLSQRLQRSVYGQVRLRPLEGLTVVAGGRFTWYESDDLLDATNDQTLNAKFVPYVGVVQDVSRNLSAYASFSTIFNPQSDRNREGDFLPPRRGHQVELGLKGEYFDGRLTSSAAIYRIEDVNRSIPDPSNPDFSVAAGKVRSQGAEGELTGRLTPSWNLTTGYGYNTATVVRAAPGQEGQPLNTVFPKHELSLWTDYRLPGAWQALGVAGGVRFRSTIYNLNGDIRYEQGSYAVVALQGNYRINEHLKTTLTLNNLFDRRYLDRPESWTRQTYFGEPRNFMLGVSYRL